MDINDALEEVRRWCAQKTEARDPERIEVDCDAVVCVTIGESAPPWHIRWERRSSVGIGSPLAQLRYDFEREEWALHHGEKCSEGWCRHEDALKSPELGPLLDAITGDRVGRFRWLPRDVWDRQTRELES